MKTCKTLHYFVLSIQVLFFIPSCQKEKEWLDTKPNKALVVPATLTDFQNLLNRESLFNITDNALGFLASEDYYVTYPVWQARVTATERNAYVWAKDIYEGESVSDWNNNYQQVYYCNTVLEGLDKMNDAAKALTAWQQVKGTALFFRAYAFYKLAMTFAKPYDPSSASADLGIPLRLQSDPNDLSQRASIQETYDRILQDLTLSVDLLPLTTSIASRPTQTAALALLARIYLSMEDYDKALLQADKCLALNSNLLDLNTLNASASYPFSLFNKEDIFHTRMSLFGIMLNSISQVDSNLYRSYQPNDLRRTLYFSNNAGNISFRGSYEGGIAYYAGLATDEIFLVRAECNARKGNTAAALTDLNTLLLKRWKTGTFIPFTAATATEALALILTERRKELVFRGLRWTDLRRLNRDNRFAVTLTRILNGTTYTLPPNSLLYVYPIPDNELRSNPIPQNPR